jgi:rubredoxin
MHALLDEADIVIHYNGQKFDIPVLNREFLKHGLKPPSPYKQIDLFRVVKRMFRFESNKLKSILKELSLENKLEHEGFRLWTDCMDGKPAAWKKLGAYNRRDVTVLEPLYELLRPWIANHPNVTAMEKGLACPKCGSKKTQERGVQVTTTRTYQRHQCQSCGGWFRSSKSLALSGAERGVNIAV